MDSFACDIVVLSDLVKNSLQGSIMLKHCSVVIYRDTVCHLTEEYYQLSSSFSEKFVSLKLEQIVWKFWVWVCEDGYLVGVSFLSLPVGVPAVREEVPQSLLTV